MGLTTGPKFLLYGLINLFTVIIMALPAPNQIDVGDYLAFEKTAQRKHEYYDGFLIAMAGASKEHRDIQTNLITVLTNSFRTMGSACRAHGSDTRVRVADKRYFYPDIAVFCDEIVEDDSGSSLNPGTIIEILSASTEKFDQNEKTSAYKEVPSIREIILVDSRKISVRVLKKSGEFWSEQIFLSRNDSIDISGVTVSIEEIYQRVL